MTRFLALKLINNDQTLVVKIGNLIASSKNRARFFSRVIGSLILGFVSIIFTCFPYGILIVLLYFNATENCAYQCQNYFEPLAKEEPVIIYGEKSTGRLIIVGKDNFHQIEFHTLSKTSDKVNIINATIFSG